MNMVVRPCLAPESDRSSEELGRCARAEGVVMRNSVSRVEWLSNRDDTGRNQRHEGRRWRTGRTQQRRRRKTLTAKLARSAGEIRPRGLGIEMGIDMHLSGDLADQQAQRQQTQEARGAGGDLKTLQQHGPEVWAIGPRPGHQPALNRLNVCGEAPPAGAQPRSAGSQAVHCRDFRDRAGP